MPGSWEGSYKKYYQECGKFSRFFEKSLFLIMSAECCGFLGTE